MRSLLLIAALLIALPAGAVDIEYVAVADPGNPADTANNCLNDAPDCGSVPYNYAISKYEVTNAQYAEFLNAVAASDPLGLYNTSMDSDPDTGRRSGIKRSGTEGSYSYAVRAGWENKPVNYVSFYDALRFANWLHNGQPNGPQDAMTTEDGAYTITANGIGNNTITRNQGATVFLPSENEWYKAAHYSPGGTYFDYPTGTDTQTECVAPASDAGNSANCWSRKLTDVGSYGLSDSPYGTFDQGGNVWEWNETASDLSSVSCPRCRGIRGGGLNGGSDSLAASAPFKTTDPTREWPNFGFRVAPEPAHVLLMLTGGLVLAAARRRDAKAL